MDPRLREIAWFAMEHSLASTWQSWGVKPSLMIGYGVGELVAACLAGALTLEDALTLVCKRAGIAVDARVADAGEVRIPFVCGQTGRLLEPGARPSIQTLIEPHAAGDPVRGLATLFQGAGKIFLDLGPDDSGAVAASAIAGAERHIIVSGGGRELMQAVGRVWKAGASLDWAAFNAFGRSRRVRLNTYPFERRRHWIEPGSSQLSPKGRNDPGQWLHVPAWRHRVPKKIAPTAGRDGLYLLFCQPTALSNEIAAALSERGCEVVRLRTSDDYRHLLGETVRGVVYLSTSRESLFDLLELAQALEARKYRAPISFTVLTTGAHCVLGNERINPYDAMLPAALRVIAREFSELSCRNIDLPDDADDAHMIAARVADECLKAGPFESLALRGSAFFVPTYEPFAPEENESLLRRHGVYLITGGLGGIGRTLALHLARTVQARLVLVSRSAGDSISERASDIQTMEALGAQVLVLEADVSERAQVDEAIAATLEKFGCLHGVIHAAGVPGGGVVALKTRDSVSRIIAPKVAGTSALEEHVKALEPDFFLSCSSLAAVLAPAGQYDYAAANAFQDAFAHAHDVPSATRFISVNWDAWSEVGMAAGSEGLIDGDAGLSCEAGSAIFDLILRNPRPQWLVSRGDLNEKIRGGRERIRRRSRRSPVAGAASGHTNAAESQLQQIWSELLGVLEPDIHADFFELGGDSLLAVQLGARLESQFATSLSLRQIMAAPTIAALARHVAGTAS